MMEETITEVTNETPVEVVETPVEAVEIVESTDVADEPVSITVEGRAGGGTDTIYH